MTDKTKILVNDRIQCGFPGITKFHCIAIRGCCFDEESGYKLVLKHDFKFILRCWTRMLLARWTRARHFQSEREC